MADLFEELRAHFSAPPLAAQAAPVASDTRAGAYVCAPEGFPDRLAIRIYWPEDEEFVRALKYFTERGRTQTQAIKECVVAVMAFKQHSKSEAQNVG